MIRKLVRLIAVLVVIAIAAVVAIALNLDKLVKAGVEKGGALTLGVLTNVDSASVEILGGTLGIDGLTVGSPEGFEAPEMFRLGHMHVTLELRSLLRDEIVVQEVVIDGPEVTLEFAGGKTNWGVLSERLKNEPSAEEEEMKNIRIDRLVLRNGRIKLEGVPLAESQGIPLPDIEVTDLGTAEGKGVTARKAIARVVASLREGMASAVQEKLPADEFRALEQELKSAAGALLDEVTKPKDLVKSILGGNEPEGEDQSDQEE